MRSESPKLPVFVAFEHEMLIKQRVIIAYERLFIVYNQIYG
jgi:hypothetical protein